jgi:hypothetical protein
MANAKPQETTLLVCCKVPMSPSMRFNAMVKPWQIRHSWEFDLLAEIA